MNLLDNVKEENKFLLNNGKSLNNLKELYKELRRMNNKTFNHHVNEDKNDFYNWVNDIYKNKVLSDDLLECTTKEAVLFCLRNNLKQASISKELDSLPKGYGGENPLKDLPKGYGSQRITKREAGKLVTLINLDEVRIKSEVKSLFSESKNKVSMAVKTDNPFFEIQKKSMKKVKALDNRSMIEKVKEVYLN